MLSIQPRATKVSAAMTMLLPDFRQTGGNGLLAVAGAVNSVLGSGDRLHVAAWQTKKKITKWEEEEGGKTVIHEREQFVHELALAFADGRTGLLE
jgi:hypothetical protein